jgi:hypothetical protein
MAGLHLRGKLGDDLYQILWPGSIAEVCNTEKKREIELNMASRKGKEEAGRSKLKVYPRVAGRDSVSNK